MIKFVLKGNFKNSEKFFNGVRKILPQQRRMIFDKYGKIGVAALQNSTPIDSGKTANSWSYEVNDWGISWTNSNILTNGIPLVILLQYGHGTKGGGYVNGRDFINPAVQPVINKIAEDCWREVQNL